jgi:chitosanase
MRIVDTNNNVTDHLGQLKALGVSAIGRYYASNHQKRLTRPEAEAITAADLDIFVVFENSGDPQLSFDSGVNDAQIALGQAKTVGQPGGTGIYFALEHEKFGGFSLAHVPGIKGYLEGVRSVLSPHFKVGVYGDGVVCKAALDAGLCEFTWLSASTKHPGTPEFTASGRATLIQRRNVDQMIDGLSIDFNDAKSADFGQFRIITAQPAIADEMMSSAGDVPAAPQPEFGTMAAPLPSGWVFLLQRLREELRPGKQFRRTVGTYQIFHDGLPVSGLAGMTVERQGPGDNTLTGKHQHRCIEAATYNLVTHVSDNYRTVGYATTGEHPRPAIEVSGTNRRSEILIHPGVGYGSTIGCINLAARLSDANADISLDDSTRRVVDVVADLKVFVGGHLPSGNKVPLHDCRLIVLEPSGPRPMSDSSAEDPAAVLTDAAMPAEAARTRTNLAPHQVDYFVYASSWKGLSHDLGLPEAFSGETAEQDYAEAVVRNVVSERGGSHLMICFDAVDIEPKDREVDPDLDTADAAPGDVSGRWTRALAVVRSQAAKGTLLAIRVEGPGGPTQDAWSDGEVLRIIKAAKDVVAGSPDDPGLVGVKSALNGIELQALRKRIHQSRSTFRRFVNGKFTTAILPLWNAVVWWRATRDKLKTYKANGFKAAEIDHLDQLFDLDTEAGIVGLLGFLEDRYRPGHRAGELPDLIMKNLNASALAAVKAAIDAGRLQRDMFADFHIFEINTAESSDVALIRDEIATASAAFGIQTIFCWDPDNRRAFGSFEVRATAVADSRADVENFDVNIGRNAEPRSAGEDMSDISFESTLPTALDDLKAAALQLSARIAEITQAVSRDQMGANLAAAGGPAAVLPVPISVLTQIAARSSVMSHNWAGRGVAPQGYIKGMAVVYGEMYCRLKAGEATAVAIAGPINPQNTGDALVWYQAQFQTHGMGSNGSPVERLRHLFVLITGLGMRESSGRYCEGRDRSAPNVAADTAEAGPFQVSFNLARNHPELVAVFERYKANPDGHVDIFREGVPCGARDWENFGSPQQAGFQFQELTKKCPAFAVEFAALGLRFNKAHWGPIVRHEAEVLPMCQDLFLEIERAIDAASPAVAAREVGVAAAAGMNVFALADSAPVSMALTPSQRLVCERIINVFETGTIRGDYGNISIFHDGPHQIRQVTYGRAQTTEYGNLRELVQMYANAGGMFSSQLAPFVPLIGRTALVDNAEFKALLRRAGHEDPVMAQTQDVFFERRYFQPALKWANDNGFSLPLSMLVIYDSFIHSGGILDFLRSRFAERPPARGGDERTWISQYVEVRNDWLATNSNPALHPTVYRTQCFAREIARQNWDLSQLPIVAHGTPVDDRPAAGVAMVQAAHDGGEIPFLGRPEEVGDIYGEVSAEIWCEDGNASGLGIAGAAAAAPADTAALAARILASLNITLATGHPSGVVDDANARQNIIDTAAGAPARRSSYGNAPGGTVVLDIRMLRGLLSLADRYTVSVSELCGGSHSPNSRHYAGLGFDITEINGRPVRAGHPDLDAFKARCRELGATEVLGPGQPGHATHAHAAWPRTLSGMQIAAAGASMGPRTPHFCEYPNCPHRGQIVPQLP